MSVETFSSMLRRLRRQQGLSTWRLAECAFASQSSILHLESGRLQHPTREMVAAIAAGLALDGVDTARLLIAAGYFPWRMSDAAITAFVEAVEEASATGSAEEPVAIRRRVG